MDAAGQYGTSDQCDQYSVSCYLRDNAGELHFHFPVLRLEQT